MGVGRVGRRVFLPSPPPGSINTNHLPSPIGIPVVRMGGNTRPTPTSGSPVIGSSLGLSWARDSIPDPKKLSLGVSRSPREHGTKWWVKAAISSFSFSQGDAQSSARRNYCLERRVSRGLVISACWVPAGQWLGGVRFVSDLYIVGTRPHPVGNVPLPWW